MSGVIDLARRISECSNPLPYTPMIGKIISLPEPTIQIGSKITVTRLKDGYDVNVRQGF